MKIQKPFLFSIICIVGFILFLVYFIPLLGYASPKTKVIQDRSNLKQILISISQYKNDYDSFPDSLSLLIKDDYLNMPDGHGGIFTSPRGCGERCRKSDWFFSVCYVDYGNIPPEPIEIKVPEDVDDGDYLYIKPSQKNSEKEIILMTRPGLLYRRKINVVTSDGEITTMDRKDWIKDKKVIEFLEKKNIEDFNE